MYVTRHVMANTRSLGDNQGGTGRILMIGADRKKDSVASRGLALDRRKVRPKKNVCIWGCGFRQ